MILLLTLIVSAVWLWSEIMAFRNRKFRVSDDFDLNGVEARRLGACQQKVRAIEGNLARAMKKVVSLEKLAKGVRRTKTGRFDRRSKRGRKLSRELPRARAVELRYQNELYDIQSEIETLGALPEARASDWAKTESRRLANRLICPVFASTILLGAVFSYPIEDQWYWLSSLWLVLLTALGKYQKKTLMRKLGY